MTKERIAEIRKRCEDAVEVLGGVNAVLVDMFAVLDTVEEDLDLIQEVLHQRDQIEAERDRWETRAKALERALKLKIDGCECCVHVKDGNAQCCEYGVDRWQFDETRFAPEANHD